MIENFAITPSQTPLLNALSFANDILPDNSKQSDNKDTYQDIECPLLIQAAIGGDIEILKYLISKGFKDIDNVGHIALSKKQKNSVVSNVIGAAAYYGKTAMLEYLLKTYERKVDINLKAIEKKGKKKHMSLTKEYSGFNAVTLAIAGDANDETTIEVMKILDGYKVNEDVDFKENNMLHIAARFGRLGVVKHIIEDLDMERLAKETNKDGQTPYFVAESVNAKAICDYLRNNTEKDNKELEDDLKELIESGTKAKKKKKNNKGKKDDGLGLLNSSDYQETLKIEEKPIVKKKTEEIEEEESEEVEEYVDDKTKPYNNKSSNYRYNNRYDYNRRNKQYNTKGRYYNNYDDYYGNKNYNNKGYYNKRNNYQSTTLQEVEITDTATETQKKLVEPVIEENKAITVEKVTPVEEEDDIIVGLAKKNKNKGKNKKKKEEVKVEEPKEVKVEETKIEPVEENRDIPPQSSNEVKEEQLQQMEEVKENAHVHEEVPNEFKNVDDDEEEESDDDFLHEYENEPKEKQEAKLEEPIEEKKEIPISNPIVAHEQIEYKVLLDKYNELEKKFELLLKEKAEMETFIRKTYQQQTTVIPSTEENINDLMELANSELDAKNKRIEELEKKIEMYTLHDIHSD